MQSQAYLAPASATVVPANNVLVVLILLSQIVEQDTLSHRL